MFQFRHYSAAPTRRPFLAVAVAAAVAAAVLVPQNDFAATASPAVASGASGSSSSTAPTGKSLTVAQMTQVVWQGTDDVRAKAGKPVLVRNSALDKVAADWAKQQYLNGAMSHNPNYSTQIPAGWQRAGENVAKGYYYNEVVDAWVASPSHYANLVNDYTDIGIGYYEADGKRYWSQVFAKYPSTQVPARTAAPATSASPSPSATPAPTATTTPAQAAPAKPTPAPAPTTSAAAAAEPAAPAGTAIPLASSSFEGSKSGWSGSGLSLIGPNSEARGGRYALGVTGASTVSQTVSVSTTVGETYTATIWVRPGSTGEAAGRVTLSTVGGTAESGSISYKVSSGWMKVTVSVKITKPGHTGVTLAVVQANGSSRLDSASLVRTGNAAAATAATPAPASSSAPAASSTPAPSSPPASAAPAPAATPAKPAAPAPAPAASTAPAPAAAPSQSPGLVAGLIGGLLG